METETETKMPIAKTETEIETKPEMQTKAETKTTGTKTEMTTDTETETKTKMPIAKTETEIETEPEMQTKTETKMETETETETVGTGTETETRAVVTRLPQFIVFNQSGSSRYVNYRENSSIENQEPSVFSPLVKIEVERSQSNPNSGRVHLRFCHSNKYWYRWNRQTIRADVTEPIEDLSDLSCTLFSIESTGLTSFEGAPLFTILHVQTGGRLRAASNMRSFSVTTTQNPTYFVYVDWSTLVNLPPRVAFKGYNDKYLRAVTQDRWYNYHKFESDDPNEKQCGYEVFPTNNGHVRIRSDHWEMFWQRNSNWIWGNAPANTTSNRDTLFWPVLVDNENTISLRNAGNNMFCAALSADGKRDCLSAVASTTTNPARLVVEELVSDRRIYNIGYRMEHSRIFNETPYVAGSSRVTNHTDQEASMAVEIEYTSATSNSFSNSITLTAGMSNTFEGGIPWIFSGRIEVYMEGSYTREWGQTVTTSQTIRASGSVVVPPRSTALVSYIGARGTCNVPFSYTQQDRNSNNGTITNTEKIDGIFEGVNSYDFQFVVTSTRSLDLPK